MSALVAPVLGEVTAFFLFYSASPGLWRDRQRGQLSTDPLPFPIALLANLLWILYATLISDPWILLGNMMGLAATTFNTLTVLRLCSEDSVLRRLELILGCGIVFVGAMLSSSMLLSSAVMKSLTGNVCIAIILVMYGSPALAAFRALRTGDASAVSLPLALAQLANGLLWGVYGMALGDVVVMGPNLLGAALAVLNLVAKLRSFCGAQAQPAQPEPDATSMALLSGEAEIRVRSLHYSRFVRVAEADSAVEQGSGVFAEVSVADDEGTVLKVVPLHAAASEDVTERRFALRTQDGRFVQVCPRPASLRASALNPSPWSVIACQSESPGAEGEFVAVLAPAQDKDHYVTTASRATHRYAEEGVGFWNPLHKVFVRANEFGVLDCSPECNSMPTLGLLMPAGWEWERFTVHSASAEGLRSRAALIGKAASVATAASAM